MEPINEANDAHLALWIPARVAEPVPLAELREWLSSFSTAFDDSRERRYGLFDVERLGLLGGGGAPAIARPL